MTTESSKINILNENIIPSKESNSSSNSNLSSFSNYIDQSTIMPFKLFLKENIKSFNLLPNEENSTKENELENSLKAKYHFDTPTLEINLKVTSDYELIKKKLKEYLELFGEIKSLEYDHNANNIKINYKYYFSCLYANRSLTNILQNKNEINSAINYYSNCEYSNKGINTTISKEKINNKDNPDKDFNQAFKFLTENYKTNTKFKTQIYKKDNDKNSLSLENIVNIGKSKNNIENETNFEELKNDNKDSTKNNKSIDNSKININNFSNSRTKYKWIHNNSNNYYNGKKSNNNFYNQMNNVLSPPNLFYQYLSMNNPKTIKIPVPVPIPFPLPMPLATPKINKNKSYNINTNENYSSFSKQNIKSLTFLNQTKEKMNIQYSLNKTKMQTQSNDNKNDSPEINSKNNSNQINIFYDNLISNVNISSDQNSIPKINDNYVEKENNSNDVDKKEISDINEEKDTISEKEKNSSSNISDKSSQENAQKNDIISSIKFDEKNNIDILSTMGQKRLSLDKLNTFLQNNKPVSNFSNPIKNLSSEENEFISGNLKKIPLPFFLPFPIQLPFKLPKFNKNQYLFPSSFNKKIIDFDKLTLNTRNTIKFDTHSSRDYFYKYVCNYLIQIENDDNFLVTKRIIGKNGCFLKKIIQESCIKYGDFSTKIRLRGKGSGYLEQNGKESDEPLMLCISSLNYPTYYNCCSLIDSLLKKVYNDYYDYLLKILPKDLNYSVIKKNILKHEFVVNRFASGKSGKNKDKKKKIYKESLSKEKNN